MVSLLRRGRRGLPVAGVSASSVLVLVAATLGLHMPNDGRIPGFAAPAGVDYSRSHVAFPQLRAPFLASVLGAVPGGVTVGGAPAGSGPRVSSLFEPDAPRVIVNVPALKNDAFADAYPMPPIPSTARTRTAGATREREPTPSCSKAGGGTVWFRFTAPSDERLAANTFDSTYPTVLAVFTGTGLDELHEVQNGCASDGRGDAQVVFQAVADTTYYFQIAGQFGRTGLLVFNLEKVGSLLPAVLGDHGKVPNGLTYAWGISADGRYLSIWSYASNLIAGYSATCEPTNYAYDYASALGNPSCGQVYVRDRWLRTNTLASVSQSGEPGDNTSIIPALSGDGRLVAFASEADNLGDPTTTNPVSGFYAVFARDLRTGRLTEPSGVGNDGFHPALSYDGRYVAFTSSHSYVPEDRNGDNFDPLNPLYSYDLNQGQDTYVFDEWTGRYTLAGVSSSGRPGNYNTGGGQADYSPSITPDGRYVVFASDATNLDPGSPDTNHATDVFVHDFLTGKTTRVSVASDGSEARGGRSYLFLPGPTISADGKFVVFASEAPNLVPPRDRPAGVNGAAAKVGLNVFLHDMVTGATTLISQLPTGGPGTPSEAFGGGAHVQDSAAISADGRYVVYSTRAQDPTEPKTATPPQRVFLVDRYRGTRIRISVNPATGEDAKGDCEYVTISADGRFVVFNSTATNLISDYPNYSGGYLYMLPQIR